MTDTGDTVAARYARAMRVGIVVILAVWHFGYDVLIIARGWSRYDPPTAAAAAWLIIAGVQVIGSVMLLKGQRDGDRLLAAIAVGAGVVALVSYPPGAAVSDISWAWNTVGWCGVLLLLRRPWWELAVMLSVNTATTVVAVAADGSLSPVMTSRLMSVTYATFGIQLLFAVVAHHLDGLARRATDLTLAQAENRSRAAIDEAVHLGRQGRYAEIRDRVEPLVRGLADGTLDHTDPAVRRTAGIEAARLRRLFAETDDTPDPLLHELRASADLAERRGVDVNLLTYGRLPAVPTKDRRVLTEVILLVLASTANRARVTAVADDAEVVLSVLADAPADVLADLRGDLPVSVVHDPDGNQIWVEVRWQRPSNPSG